MLITESYINDIDASNKGDNNHEKDGFVKECSFAYDATLLLMFFFLNHLH